MAVPHDPPPTAPNWARPAAIAVLCIAAVVLVAWVVRDDGRAPGRAGSASDATTTTIGVRIPTASDPLRVLVAGDSLVGWIAPALEEEIPPEDPVEVIDDWKGSTGLIRTDYFDWPARIEQDMTAHDPDVVVLGFGGNDTQGITTDAGVLALGTPAWKTEYQRRVGEVLDLIEAPGRTVYWVGLPLTRSDAIEDLRPVMTSAIEAEVGSRPWAHLIDTRDALAPDGTFTSQLPDEDGELVTTMAPDDIHPSLEGGVRIVDEFLPQLAAERHLSS
jgi:hypothetical protein